MDTEHSGTLPWVSVEWLNQANFPFFLSGKPAGVLPFTDKMVSVKYQEQDINREHAASDRQKKKTRNSAYTHDIHFCLKTSSWIKNTKCKNKGIWKYEILQHTLSEDNPPFLSALCYSWILQTSNHSVKVVSQILVPLMSMAKFPKSS